MNVSIMSAMSIFSANAVAVISIKQESIGTVTFLGVDGPEWAGSGVDECSGQGHNLLETSPVG